MSNAELKLLDVMQIGPFIVLNVQVAKGTVRPGMNVKMGANKYVISIIQYQRSQLTQAVEGQTVGISISGAKMSDVPEIKKFANTNIEVE